MQIPITLRRLSPCATVSFAVPLPPLSTSGLTASAGGQPIPIRKAVLLWWHDPQGVPVEPKSILVQFDAAYMPGETLDLDLETGGGLADDPMVPFAHTSTPTSYDIAAADYALVQGDDGVYRCVAQNPRPVPLFASRLPCTVAEFPPGYLASTGLFGPLLSAEAVATDPALAGAAPLARAFPAAVRSGIYRDEWPILAASIVTPMPVEGFLYDRAATILLALAHTGDPVFLQPAYAYAWSYASQILLEGTYRGYWAGKSTMDSKYSHARGVYLYYALTGDEGALAALTAMGDLWAGDPLFSLPYQQGKIRGRDKLWTERLLGTAFEGCFYGFAATGERRYLSAFEALLHTAHRHISTTDQAELDAIMQPYTDPAGVTHRFPPQNAWIHNQAQASEGSMTEPWCSGWMIELVLDSLIAYQTMTGDARVDDIFVRLGCYLRDTGTSYFANGVLFDEFLKPSIAYTTADKNPRRVIPMYGAGRYLDGTRKAAGEYTDYEHVPDTTGLTAAAWRGLVRLGVTGPAIGPFASERDCAAALHEEYVASAKHSLSVRDLTNYRDPACPSGSYHAQGRLAQAYAKPDQGAAYLATYKIGGPRWYIYPERKLSWWFNSSMLQFGLLSEQGLAIPVARQGFVQPGDQPPPPPVNHPPSADAGGPYEVVEGVELTLPGVGTDPDGDLLVFVWDFGDGAGGADQVGRHTYATPGIYVATLTVTDSKGLSASDTAQVTVRDAPPTYDELVAQVAALEAMLRVARDQVAALTAQHDADVVTITALRAQVAALEAKVAEAVAVLVAP